MKRRSMLFAVAAVALTSLLGVTALAANGCTAGDQTSTATKQ